MHSFWRKVAALCLAAAAIAASVAIATADTGGNDKSSAGGSAGTSKAAVPAGPDEHLSALAKELGVSTGDLRDAFEAVREELGPRERPSGRPSRAELEKRCNEMTDALASKLGKSGDEVRAATKKVIKAGIADAVKDKRLTQSQANKILDRLDDAACLPAFGRGRGGHCGPPHGARRGSDSGESVKPAPQSGGPAMEFAPAV